MNFFARKDESSKVIKLIGAIVLVFGTAIWRVANADGGPSPAPKTVAAVESSATTPSPAPAAATPSDSLITVPPANVPNDLEPFQPLAPIRTETPKPTTTPPPAMTGAIAPAPQAAPQPLAVNPVASAPAPDSTPLQLTGLVPGARATAVIQSGSKEHVVRVGSHLANGATVIRIGSDSVTLKKGSTVTVLSMEG